MRRPTLTQFLIIASAVGSAGLAAYYFGAALKSYRPGELVMTLVWGVFYVGLQALGHLLFIPKPLPVHCPNCGEELPKRYKGRDWHQRYYGWKDCPGCGLEVNMYGEPAKRYPQWQGGKRCTGPDPVNQ